LGLRTVQICHKKSAKGLIVLTTTKDGRRGAVEGEELALAHP
jgi:hypothetical protein